MNWIAAYIQAVKTNLPSAKREDVSEELRSLLEEEFENARGHGPDQAEEAEVMEWLKSREHPALVAARYHDRRNLISEDSFPLYKLTLRYVFIGLAVAYTCIAAISAFSSGDYHLSISDLAYRIVHAGLISFAVVTLIFHFCDKQLSAAQCLANWNPKELPDPTRKWEQEPWSSSISGLAFTLVFLLLINGYLGDLAQSLAGARWGGLEFKLAEPVVALLPWINVVLLGSLILHGFMIFKPRWSSITLSANIILSIGATLIAYQLQDAYPILELIGEAENKEHNIEKLAGMLSTSFRVAMVIIIFVNLFEIGRGAWRLYQLGNRRLF